MRRKKSRHRPKEREHQRRFLEDPEFPTVLAKVAELRALASTPLAAETKWCFTTAEVPFSLSQPYQRRFFVPR